MIIAMISRKIDWHSATRGIFSKALKSERLGICYRVYNWSVEGLSLAKAETSINVCIFLCLRNQIVHRCNKNVAC